MNASYEDGNMLSQEDCCKRINAIKMDMVRNGVRTVLSQGIMW